MQLTKPLAPITGPTKGNGREIAVHQRRLGIIIPIAPRLAMNGDTVSVKTGSNGRNTVLGLQQPEVQSSVLEGKMIVAQSYGGGLQFDKPL